MDIYDLDGKELKIITEILNEHIQKLCLLRMRVSASLHYQTARGNRGKNQSGKNKIIVVSPSYGLLSLVRI